MSDDDLSKQTFPWLRSAFDLEGYVGALTAWLVGILLGLLWAPLFWIGFLAAIIILLGTRTATRTPPLKSDVIVAPCDGIVVSVEDATPPDELRLRGDGWSRVRVSCGPASTNGVYAPMDGAIDHIVRETGDPSAFVATRPDKHGLAVAYIAFESGSRSIGVRLATGGLGPRLEVTSEPGDGVRIGRVVGTLRLGGWCDIYIPASAEADIAVGQTLIGAETVLATIHDGLRTRAEPEQVVTPPAPEPDPDPQSAHDKPDELDADIAEASGEAESELSLETIAQADEEPVIEAEDDEDEEDVAQMFARLRKEARKASDD